MLAGQIAQMSTGIQLEMGISLEHNQSNITPKNFFDFIYHVQLTCHEEYY